MKSGRVEAFSDGVIAIIITIMVLELKVPHSTELASLKGLLPVFLSYVLSFVYVGIYWNNHHHLFHAVKHVSGTVLWANLHLLFWLSLIPFVSGWMGENHFEPVTVMLYGVVLLGAALSYSILTIVLLRTHGHDSTLARSIRGGYKEKASLVLYAVGVAAALWFWWLACACYVAVTILWLIPDRRIEHNLHETERAGT
jgi:uncharacterized membrane protein